MERIAAPARMDMDNAPEALAELSRALGPANGARAAGAATVVDLSALAQFDSGALAVLLQLARGQAAAAGGGRSPLLLTGAPPKLRELAALYGVDELLFGAASTG